MTLIGVTLAAMAIQGQIRLSPHTVISSSGSVERRLYAIPASEDLKSPAVTISGNNITVDFQGATLEGTPQTAEPSDRKGLGISVHGKNITIKNLRVRGYKVGLMARGCTGLKIVDSDFSYNWKQHLASTLEREDESDWQSYHHNEQDEWLRYGAGIYMRGCDNFEIKGCKAVGGQCGLMMMESNHGLVWNSYFSFLSGIGIGMYKSSDNRIMYNKIDWCVRGFSYGVYNRGQDSAGILIYEQSNRNVFAYNSVTHGGDGFFLWAGQTTMDTGEGGCNDNLLYGNDFSHSPANGIESTFSKNNFINNLMLECWHGIWGGYSYENKVIGNVFGRNDEAIAWEHGQDNIVDSNMFIMDKVGIHIWGGDVDPKFVFAQKRDTRSKNWRITNNAFGDEFTAALDVNKTQGVDFKMNRLAHNGKDILDGGQVTDLNVTENGIVPGKPAALGTSLNPGLDSGPADYLRRFKVAWNPYPDPALTKGGSAAGLALINDEIAANPYAPAQLKGAQHAFLKPDAFRGWRYILVDEWGPFDFKRPILWPRGKAPFKPGATNTFGSTPYQFEVLGPPGKWRVVGQEGILTISPLSGTTAPGSMIVVSFPPGKASNIKLTLEYTGEATTDYRGIVTPAGKPVRFGYSQFFAPIDWTIHFFKWSKPEDPAEVHSVPAKAEFEEILKGPALKELRSDKLDFAGGSFDAVTGSDHFATVADGSFTVQPGNYTLDMTADDGAKLWLDGKLLIADAWHYQGPTLYSRTVHLGAGKHTIRVEHFQIDGYAALKVDLRPKP